MPPGRSTYERRLKAADQGLHHKRGRNLWCFSSKKQLIKVATTLGVHASHHHTKAEIARLLEKAYKAAKKTSKGLRQWGDTGVQRKKKKHQPRRQEPRNREPEPEEPSEGEEPLNYEPHVPEPEEEIQRINEVAQHPITLPRVSPEAVARINEPEEEEVSWNKDQMAEVIHEQLHYSGGHPAQLNSLVGVMGKWVRIKKSKIPGAGEGVFALRDIPRGTVATTYGGFVYTKKKLKERYPNEDDQTHVMQAANNVYIDGAEPFNPVLASQPDSNYSHTQNRVEYRTGLAQMINSNEDNPNINLEAAKYDGDPFVIAVAIRKITKGQELYTDYNGGATDPAERTYDASGFDKGGDYSEDEDYGVKKKKRRNK